MTRKTTRRKVYWNWDKDIWLCWNPWLRGWTLLEPQKKRLKISAIRNVSANF